MIFSFINIFPFTSKKIL